MWVNLIWSLYQEETLHTIERHCSTCGRTTTFTDSGKKRRNANGKNIFEYIIYRCEKGHSWNHKINQYKASESGQYALPENTGQNGNGNGSRQKIQPLALSEYQARGITVITIQLEAVEGAWRLDKLLATHIEDLSRTRLRKMIKAGQILFNDQKIKPGIIVKQQGTIQINLGKYTSCATFLERRHPCRLTGRMPVPCSHGQPGPGNPERAFCLPAGRFWRAFRPRAGRDAGAPRSFIGG
jgi:hypothetical protein